MNVGGGKGWRNGGRICISYCCLLNVLPTWRVRAALRAGSSTPAGDHTWAAGVLSHDFLTEFAPISISFGVDTDDDDDDKKQDDYKQNSILDFKVMLSNSIFGNPK